MVLWYSYIVNGIFAGNWSRLWCIVFKCPFHGLIIPRDEMGRPINPEDAVRLEKEEYKRREEQPGRTSNSLSQFKTWFCVCPEMTAGYNRSCPLQTYHCKQISMRGLFDKCIIFAMLIENDYFNWKNVLLIQSARTDVIFNRVKAIEFGVGHCSCVFKSSCNQAKS